MRNIEYFMNDRYMLLKFLKSNEIHIKNDVYIPLSQQEIADGIGSSKLKTNKLINDLKDAGYIISFMDKQGKYQITDSGNDIMNGIRRLEATTL